MILHFLSTAPTRYKIQDGFIAFSCIQLYTYKTLHSVKKQVQLHFSCTAVSSEDSSATDLLMLQTQYKSVHVYTDTYMHTVYAMGVVHNLMLCMYVLARTCMQHKVRHIYTGTYMLLVGVF